MPTAKKMSYALFAGTVVATIWLKLGPVVLAALFSFMVLDITHRRLAALMPEPTARGLSLLIFLVTAVGVAWMFIFFLKLTLLRTPAILTVLIPRIHSMAESYGFDLPFEDLHQLRQIILQTVKENAGDVTEASGLLTKRVFQIIVSVFVAILCFLSEGPRTGRDTLFDSIRREVDDRVGLFMRGFEKILGAQVLVSFINTGITALFILAMGLPHVNFLILATFILGIIPILGNVISNAIIVATALTISAHLALIALAFLIIIHKLQYFLNSQIVGARTNIPIWQILLGLLIGEAVLGVPGIILAPAMLHYVREELRALPDKPR